MAPKKKGKADTPEQIAAKRAAAMAMFSTSSTPKPDSGKPPPKLPAAPLTAPATSGAMPPPPPDVAALGLDDNPAPTQAGIASDTLTKNAPVNASGVGAMAGGFTAALPSDSSWVKMLSIEPTPAMLKAAKKQGDELAGVPNDCKIIVFKDVAYLLDPEGRTNPACWRTKLQGANLGTGEQPMVRSTLDRMARIVGKDSLIFSAIQEHTGVSLTRLPTGHVQVFGDAEACAAAMELIDDLVDADGAKAKETLATHLVVAEPWPGLLEVPCHEDWAGAVIGKGGAGLKAIASESGAVINYFGPEEIDAEIAKAVAKEGRAKEGGKGAAKDVAVDGGKGDEGAKVEDDRGFFRIIAKFENQGVLAAKRIEERLSMVQVRVGFPLRPQPLTPL